MRDSVADSGSEHANSDQCHLTDTQSSKGFPYERELIRDESPVQFLPADEKDKVQQSVAMQQPTVLKAEQVGPGFLRVNFILLLNNYIVFSVVHNIVMKRFKHASFPIDNSETAIDNINHRHIVDGEFSGAFILNWD